jgi:energy-coupling factor transporter ATP-binding protein EcfA2
MKLIGLSIQGLRKISAVELDFDGKSLIQVRGQNGAGKSTVIDAIKILLRGGRDIPDNVVQNGKAEAVIIGKIDDYIVKRVIKADGKSALAIEREGGKIARPQEFLDAIAGQFLDPEWFMNLPPAEKREVIIKYAGIDFTEIDKQIAGAEQERLLIGRELRALGTPQPVEPCEPIDIVGLMDKRREIEIYNKEQRDRAEVLKAYCIEISRKVSELFYGLTDADGLKVALKRATEIINSRLDSGNMPPQPLELASTEEIDQAIAGAEAQNAKARAYEAYLEAKDTRDAKEAEYEAMQKRVEGLRQARSDMMNYVKLPVKGLRITETGLEHNGVSCENWSTSESLKIGLMLAAAYAGDLKTVYIKRGESFDSASLDAIKKFAESHDIQVVMEVVDDGYDKEDAGIIWLEEGEVVAAKKAQA